MRTPDYKIILNSIPMLMVLFLACQIRCCGWEIKLVARKRMETIAAPQKI